MLTTAFSKVSCEYLRPLQSNFFDSGVPVKSISLRESGRDESEEGVISSMFVWPRSSETKLFILARISGSGLGNEKKASKKEKIRFF